MNIREDKANKESISNAKSKIKAMLQEIKDEESYDRSLIEAEVTNLKPGQKVFVPSINKHGIIESIKNTKVKLNIEHLL